MKMIFISVCLFIVTLLSAVLPAGAEDMFDGTKPLLCASIEAIDCAPGEQCEKGLPEIIGAPQFMRVDFEKKQIIGPKRTAEIRLMEKNDEQIMIQGYELGMGWALALDRITGKMTVTFARAESAFVVFGACTTLP
jgi:hypothetical protein